MAQQIGTYRGVPVFRVSREKFVELAMHGNIRGAFSPEECVSIASQYGAKASKIFHHSYQNTSYKTYLVVLERQ